MRSGHNKFSKEMGMELYLQGKLESGIIFKGLFSAIGIICLVSVLFSSGAAAFGTENYGDDSEPG